MVTTLRVHIGVKVKKGHAHMLIGELSARTGVGARLLRYYEEQGVLSSTRGSNGYRIYDETAITRVRQIRALLDAGLGTDVIRALLPCARGDVPVLEPCPEVVRRLRAELAAMDGRIDDLQERRAVLAGYVPGA